MKKLVCIVMIFTLVLCLFGCDNKNKSDGGFENTVNTKINTADSRQSETESVSQDETETESEALSETEKKIIKASLNKETVKNTTEKPKAEETTAKKEDDIIALNYPETIGMWITCFEMSMKGEGGGTQQSFTDKMNGIFDHAVNMGVNTVIVQVRGYGDAWYKSSVFPWSYYITGTQGKNPGYDPLAIMVDLAHSKKLSIEAWINPYRIAKAADYPLSENNPAKKWLDEGSPNVYSFSGGIYYNPASVEVQQLLISGIKEIVENYKVDGIHIDDYFYPTTDSGIDGESYQSYKSSGGTLSLADFRRSAVSAFVSGMYSGVKSINENVRVGISPNADIGKDYNELYADIYLWCSKAGYIDYIAPQIYFALNHKTFPFEQTLESWEKIVTYGGVRLLVGLAAYKCGKKDAFAGEKYSDEWINNDDILSQELGIVRSRKRCGGVILFSYSYTVRDNINPTAQTEMDKLVKILR